MSMNLHLRAEREVVVKKTGKSSIQHKEIDLIQTPTEVTYKLMEAKNIFEAYKKYVLTLVDKTDTKEAQEDRIFDLNEILNSTAAEMKALEEEGYTLEFYVM